MASALIDDLTETDPGYLSLVTVVELYWVLRSAYRVSPARCAELVESLLDARDLRVDRDAIVRASLTTSRGGLHFADAVIAELGRAAGCDHTVTIDQRAARDGAMQVLGPGDRTPDP